MSAAVGLIPLRDFEPKELVALGHALRCVPGNACVTGDSAKHLGDGGIVFITASEPFKSAWNKLAAAISEREDMAPYRKDVA